MTRPDAECAAPVHWWGLFPLNRDRRLIACVRLEPAVAASEVCYGIEGNRVILGTEADARRTQDEMYAEQPEVRP